MKPRIIQWKSRLVAVAKIRPTPNNYKIKNALGLERLKTSLAKFGLAGTVVVNTDFTLIDGNSRLEQAKAKGLKQIEVSVPSRKLDAKEFKEMSALFDFAKAGEVDIERIQGDLGSTKDFFKNWNIEPPLKSLGAAGHLKEFSKEVKQKSAVKGGEVPEVVAKSDYTMVQLFFDDKQEMLFRKIEEKLKIKFKVRTTSDVVLEAFKRLGK